VRQRRVTRRGDNDGGQRDEFRVVVSNTAGTVTSAAATLTVTQRGALRSPRTANQTVTAADSNLTVVATGRSLATSGRRTCECKRCDSGELHDASDNDGDSGTTFRVVVSNTAGTVTMRQQR